MTNLGFRRSRRGTIFKVETGKLYIFRPGSIWVMVAWPKPTAWKKTRSNPSWVHFRPKIRIPVADIERRIALLELPAERNGQLLLLPCLPPKLKKARDIELAWLRWYQTIPCPFRKLVSGFCNRHWHLLSFTARCGEPAVDLIRTNPALAYALASNWVFHRPAVQRPLRSARALLAAGRKQRDILAWLGFPGTKAARRILAKVVRESISIPALLYLRQGMVVPSVMKTLAHVSRVNAGGIRIVTDPELLPVAAPTLIEEIVHRKDEDQRPRAAYMLRESLRMFRLLFPRGAKFHEIRQLADLEAFHDFLSDDLHRAALGNVDVALPQPPLRGTETIVPIRDARGMFEEGRIQRNCVASYIKRVALDQDMYVYRVLWPERCTLSVARRGHTWVMGELKRARNEPPSEATRRVVENWIAFETGPDTV